VAFVSDASFRQQQGARGRSDGIARRRGEREPVHPVSGLEPVSPSGLRRVKREALNIGTTEEDPVIIIEHLNFSPESFAELVRGTSPRSPFNSASETRMDDTRGSPISSRNPFHDDGRMCRQEPRCCFLLLDVVDNIPHRVGVDGEIGLQPFGTVRFRRMIIYPEIFRPARQARTCGPIPSPRQNGIRAGCPGAGATIILWHRVEHLPDIRARIKVSTGPAFINKLLVHFADFSSSCLRGTQHSIPVRNCPCIVIARCEEPGAPITNCEPCPTKYANAVSRNASLVVTSRQHLHDAREYFFDRE